MTVKFVWTRAATARFLRRGTFDPRHTVTGYEVDLNSPWLLKDFSKRANGSPWLLIDADTGDILAGTATDL